MSDKLDELAQHRLFGTARTRNRWTDRTVTESQLRELSDLLKFGTTTFNCCPAVFVRVDRGPLSGFNDEAVDQEFFANTGIKSNFTCSIGHGSDQNLFPRNPRLTFEEAGRLA